MGNETLNDTRIGNGEMPAEMDAEFLLRFIIPKHWEDFRKQVENLRGKPKRVFTAEIYRWIKRHYHRHPHMRAQIYKKLDCIQNGESWDPWGYHIVYTKDHYAIQYYKRTLNSAVNVRKHHLDKWEKFKADWPSMKHDIVSSLSTKKDTQRPKKTAKKKVEDDDIPKLRKRAVKTKLKPKTKKPGDKAWRGKTRFVWTDEKVEEIIRRYFIDKEKPADIKESMGLRKKQYDGILQRIKKRGHFSDIYNRVVGENKGGSSEKPDVVNAGLDIHQAQTKFSPADCVPEKYKAKDLTRTEVLAMIAYNQEVLIQ